MTRFAVFVLAASLGVATACSDGSTQEPPAPSPSSTGDSLDAGAGTSTHAASAALLRCAIGRQAPTSITDAITRINALAPADGPCIVAALPRPLSVVATVGRQSAQPADGDRSPRIFFLLPKLVVSAVPSGPGSKVLEFGEWVTTSRTIKGEIALPVTAPLATDAAFARVTNRQGIATSCSSCHAEERSTTIAKAFVSNAFQPDPGQIVSVAALSAMHDECTNDDDTTDRCAMLHAIFDVGKVIDGRFSSDVGFFF